MLLMMILILILITIPVAVKLTMNMKTDSSEFDDEHDDDNGDFNSEDSEFDHHIEDHFILIILRWTQKSPGQGCLAEIFIYNPLHTKKTTHWKQIFRICKVLWYFLFDSFI